MVAVAASSCPGTIRGGRFDFYGHLRLKTREFEGLLPYNLTHPLSSEGAFLTLLPVMGMGGGEEQGPLGGGTLTEEFPPPGNKSGSF